MSKLDIYTLKICLETLCDECRSGVPFDGKYHVSIKKTKDDKEYSELTKCNCEKLHHFFNK